MLAPLPIDDHVGSIEQALQDHGAVVVVAPPGAGKTTRVPPALATTRRVIVLQPRRVAARALARRIAAERGWTPGEEVGWQVRFERRFNRRTRLLVATEGILTRRLQDDPLLSDFDCVVLDEFHERSLHADMALALVRQARIARPELGLVVMSATLDAAPVCAFLDDCPLIDVPGRPYPVTIEYDPHGDIVRAATERSAQSTGHVLCFLPGAPEIHRAIRQFGRPSADVDVDVLPLYGALAPDEQDRVLSATKRRKVIFATNVAETSLTIDGVTDVIDSGLHKVLRRDPALGLDRLEAERISRDSADQRAGRAGRTGPGRTLRLWAEHDVLRPHREPEIERVDLAAALLDIFAWGEDPAKFAWFQAPPDDAAAQARQLLERIGAVAGESITDLGRQLRRFPLHPRLAALLVAAGGSREAAAACAILAEGWTRHDTIETTRSDLLALADRVATAPGWVRRTAKELHRLAGGAGPLQEERFLRAVLAAWPDRVARRRPGDPQRLLLSGGHGAALDPASGVRESDYLVALDLVAGQRGAGAEARVRLASAIDREWLEPTRTEVEHDLELRGGSTPTVRAVERSFYDALILAERPAPVDPERAATLLARAWLDRGPDAATEQALRRLVFAGIEVDPAAIVERACAGHTSLPAIDLLEWLPYDQRKTLDRRAPQRLSVPSGRSVELTYRDDGTVEAAVKLQELFGLAETPRIGDVPVTLLLLAPNRRPVQTTRDLRSFWNTTYPEVRRELRGRYPKHPWPEDPWTAPPTARTKRRR